MESAPPCAVRSARNASHGPRYNIFSGYFRQSAILLMRKGEKKVSYFPEQDVRAIQDIHHQWLNEERRGNPVAVLQWCTEDVRWIPPDSPVLAGKEAIRKWLKTDEVEIKSLEVTNLQIHGSGSVAYKTGDYSTSYVEPHSSEIYRVKGTHLWVLHKSSDDEWKVAVVAWNSTSKSEDAA